MKLKEFTEWKAQALAHWNGVIDSSINGFYTKVASGGSQYENKTDIQTFIVNELNSLESLYNIYITNPIILDKTKDALISFVSYISMREIVTCPEAPPIPKVFDSTKNWYCAYTLDLPDYTTYFNIVDELITIAGSGGTYETNEQMLQAHVWYASDPPYPESPVYSPSSSADIAPPLDLVTCNGIITCPSTSATHDIFTGTVGADVSTLSAFQASVFTGTKDNIIYRIYGEPTTLVTKAKAKPILLENYNFSEVLTLFNWTIKGIN
jgi:hypothetical protein